MNNTKSSVIGIKPKKAAKLDIVKLDKSEKYSEENVLPKGGLYRHLHQPVNNMEVKNRGYGLDLEQK